MRFCVSRYRLLPAAILMIAGAIALPASATPALKLAEALQIQAIDPIRLRPTETADVPEFTPTAEGELRRLEPPDLPDPETQEARVAPPKPRPSETVTAEAAKIPPPPATITLAAAAYRKFRSDLTAIAALRLDRPKNLRRAEEILSSQSDAILARGWIAACAEIALRSPAFAAGIAAAAAERDLKTEVEKQPFAVHNIAGADAAIRDILNTVAADEAFMAKLATRLMDIAYERETDEAGLAKAAKAETVSATMSGSGALGLNAKARPLTTQMLALAVRIELEKNDPEVRNLTTTNEAVNKDNDQCLRWARLNLDQCLSAARLTSERAFCLSRHGITERSECWSWIAEP